MDYSEELEAQLRESRTSLMQQKKINASMQEKMSPAKVAQKRGMWK